MTVDLRLGDSEAIIMECMLRGLLRNQTAYVLATALWETAHTMKPVKEAYWLDEAWREANLHYYPWYGRGYVQLTWEENYTRAQSELDLGTLLTDTPDEALNPEYAKQIIVEGMLVGWFTGKKLSDYITLEYSDFVGARAIVNGTDCAADIAAYAVEYDQALLNIGYGVDQQGSPTFDKPARPDMSVEDLKAVLQIYAHAIYRLDQRVNALEAEFGKK